MRAGKTTDGRKNSIPQPKWLSAGVSAMQIAREFADHLYVIRYEDLVTNPKNEIARLGEFLKLDPDQFDTSIVSGAKVGSYKHRLTVEQIAEVEANAGPFLTQLGYD